MADWERDELINLQQEFDWILHEEVHTVFNHLRTILTHCTQQFPISVAKHETSPKQEKLMMSTPSQTSQDQIKCVLTLTGDTISHADINLKLHKHNTTFHTAIQEVNPWKLQQIQDSANHLQCTLVQLEHYDKEYCFKSAEEVTFALSSVLGCIQRSRNSLLIPRKRTIDDLINSRNMKHLCPPLPSDLVVSFYIQSQRLVVAAYHLSQAQGAVRFDTMQAEYPLHWINDVLVTLTVALQLCQHLRDKMNVFSQYKDMALGSRSTSAIS